MRQRLLYLILAKVAFTIAQTNGNGENAGHFVFPSLNEAQFTINYNDVLIVSWNSSYGNPRLRFWELADPSVDTFDDFLNITVDSVGSFQWSFADNASSIISWPVSGHFDLAMTDVADIPDFESGEFNITSTSGSPKTFSTITTGSSTAGSPATSSPISGSSAIATSQNSSPTSTIQGDSWPGAGGFPSGPIGSHILSQLTAAQSTVTTMQTIVVPSPSSSSASHNQRDLSAGAGIGVGVAVAVMSVVAAGAVFFRKYTRNQSRKISEALPLQREALSSQREAQPDSVVTLNEVTAEAPKQELSTDEQILELPAENICRGAAV